MKLGIVSDTHGHVANAQQAVEILRNEGVEAVIHCGDIGSVEIVPLFGEWPTHFVFGNVDGNEQQLHAAIAEAGQTCHGRFGSLELEGRRIAFLHSDDDRRFRQTIANDGWDLICYGHTHVARLHDEFGPVVLNPGALYRANPHSLAIVELPSLDVRHVTL